MAGSRQHGQAAFRRSHWSTHLRIIIIIIITIIIIIIHRHHHHHHHHRDPPRRHHHHGDRWRAPDSTGRRRSGAAIGPHT
jgi:hypothetical protein